MGRQSVTAVTLALRCLVPTVRLRGGSVPSGAFPRNRGIVVSLARRRRAGRGGQGAVLVAGVLSIIQAVAAGRGLAVASRLCAVALGRRSLTLAGGAVESAILAATLPKLTPLAHTGTRDDCGWLGGGAGRRLDALRPVSAGENLTGGGCCGHRHGLAINYHPCRVGRIGAAADDCETLASFEQVTACPFG